jgi:hypothetical protein
VCRSGLSGSAFSHTLILTRVSGAGAAPAATLAAASTRTMATVLLARLNIMEIPLWMTAL